MNYPLHPRSGIPEPELIDLISADDLQCIQDAFAEVYNVASVIADAEGTPIITQLSNGCGGCRLIRSTERGAENCRISDPALGKEAPNLMKPTYTACRIIGFIDGSAPIRVGGRHIMNRLIGQRNTMGVTKEQVIRYAGEIDVDEDALVAAFECMGTMSLDTFEKILHLLWLAAGQVSTLFYTNVRLAKDARLAHAEEDPGRSGTE